MGCCVDECYDNAVGNYSESNGFDELLVDRRVLMLQMMFSDKYFGEHAYKCQFEYRYSELIHPQ